MEVDTKAKNFIEEQKLREMEGQVEPMDVEEGKPIVA